MQVSSLNESLSLGSSDVSVLEEAENPFLECAELDAQVLLEVEPLPEGREILKTISSECVRQMKGFMADDSSKRLDLSKVVPYLQDDLFAEEVKGIRRETLEAATPNQAASMNIKNCSLFYLDGLIIESQLELSPECFATSLTSHLSSISSLSPDVIEHFLSIESVRKTIPVEILKYKIPSEAWDKLPTKLALSFVGFETEDWCKYINPSIPDEVLDLAIKNAIGKVQTCAIEKMARKHLNFSDNSSSKIRNVEVMDDKIGFLAFNLDSGAKVFVKKANSKDGKTSIKTKVHIKVNSGNDQNGGVGALAHLVEHLVLFTPVNFGSRNESILHRCMKSSGMWSSFASTEREDTFFKVKVSDNFHELCRVAKAFSQPSFSMTTVASEIKNIESENKLRAHGIDLYEMIYPHLHPENPAINYRLGNIPSFTRDDILEKANDFYRSHYCGENMEIYVSSPLPLEIVGFMIQEFFSGLPRCEKKPHKDLPSNIWATKIEDVPHVYVKDLLFDEEKYSVRAFPCNEDEYICRKAMESLLKDVVKSNLFFASSRIFYVVTHDDATLMPQPVSLIQELQALYYKKKYGDLATELRISKVVSDWGKVYSDPNYHRFFYYGKLPKRLQGSSNLIKHPYNSRIVYSLDHPPKKDVKSVAYPKHFLSMKSNLLKSEKNFSKLVILKMAQKLGIKSSLPHVLIEFSDEYAVINKELNPEYYEKDVEAAAKFLRGEIPDELRPIFAAAVVKFNNRQKEHYRNFAETSIYFLNSRIEFLLGDKDPQNMDLHKDVGFPLQLDQWSCISKWKVTVGDVKLQPNDKLKSFQDVFHKYLPPLPHKKLAPVLPKTNEFFYLAAESPFDDNAVAFSFIPESNVNEILPFTIDELNFAVYSFFRHQNSSAYFTHVSVSDRDFRVLIQSFRDPQYLFTLFNQFIIELPNIFAKEFPQFPHMSLNAEKLRDYLLSEKCGVLLIELWSSKESDWKSRKEAHLRDLQEQKGDKLKVYHNYCDYPAIEIQ